jgi:hypothetical protein
MKPRIIKHELAKTDLAGQAEYIRKDNPRAALRFLDAAEKRSRNWPPSHGWEVWRKAPSQNWPGYVVGVSVDSKSI